MRLGAEAATRGGGLGYGFDPQVGIKPTEEIIVQVRVLATAGALALSTLVAAPVLAGSAASAQPSSAAVQAPKPARDVVATGRGSGTSNLRVHIKVRGVPSYLNRRVYLQDKACRTCAWQRSQSKRTDNRAIAVFPVDAPATGRVFYRAQVPASAAYRVSDSNVLVASRS